MRTLYRTLGALVAGCLTGCQTPSTLEHGATQKDSAPQAGVVQPADLESKKQAELGTPKPESPTQPAVEEPVYTLTPGVSSTTQAFTYTSGGEEFRVYVTDSDGTMSVSHTPNLEDVFTATDSNGNREITLDEFSLGRPPVPAMKQKAEELIPSYNAALDAYGGSQ